MIMKIVSTLKCMNTNNIKPVSNEPHPPKNLRLLSNVMWGLTGGALFLMMATWWGGIRREYNIEEIPAIMASPTPPMKMARTNLVLKKIVEGDKAYLLLNDSTHPRVEFDSFTLRMIVENFEVQHGRVRSWNEDADTSQSYNTREVIRGIYLKFEPKPDR